MNKMCFSYAVNFNADALQSRLQLEDIMLPSSGFFFSGFTWPVLPVIVGKNHQFSATEMQWGLVPSWTKDEEQAVELRKLSLNAKGETVAEKPMFRNAFKSGRCLIPALGFYEWREVNKKKYPYFIQDVKHEFLLFAGISDTWINPASGEEIHTYSIVTSAANSLMEMIHNTKKRMPLILGLKDIENWVFGTDNEALNLVKPCNENMLEANTISVLASKANLERNVPEVQEKYKYPELNIQTLF